MRDISKGGEEEGAQKEIIDGETQLDRSSEGRQKSKSKQPESARKRSVAFVARGSLRR